MSQPTSNLPQWLKYGAITMSITTIVLLTQQLGIADWLATTLQNALIQVNTWGIWAPIGFILLYNVATILLIPGSILTLGSGVLFGIGWGSCYVFIAATLGATFAFLIGRYFARDWVNAKVQKIAKFQAIDRAIARQGLKIVFLLRLSPLFPFNLLNYALGITQVSLRDYILGSLGMIPATILYVYIGSLAGNVAMLGMPQPIDPQAQLGKWALQIVGFVATIGVTIYITKVAKTALDDSLNEN